MAREANFSYSVRVFVSFRIRGRYLFFKRIRQKWKWTRGRGEDGVAGITDKVRRCHRRRLAQAHQIPALRENSEVLGSGIGASPPSAPV